MDFTREDSTRRILTQMCKIPKNNNHPHHHHHPQTPLQSSQSQPHSLHQHHHPIPNHITITSQWLRLHVHFKHIEFYYAQSALSLMTMPEHNKSAITKPVSYVYWIRNLYWSLFKRPCSWTLYAYDNGESLQV